MATKREVTKSEYKRWRKWLEGQGYSGPFAGLKPSHECVKRLAKELRKDPPTIPETQPRDPRTIASNLALYERQKKRGRITSELGTEAVSGTAFTGAISGIPWQAESNIFVPFEADDAVSALFGALSEHGGQVFHCSSIVESQLAQELRGKIILFPLPQDVAVKYLEFRRALDKPCPVGGGIEALKQEADKVRRASRD